jgi:hypothetical protein
LLFNCLTVRDPQLLLPRLMETCADHGQLSLDFARIRLYKNGLVQWWLKLPTINSFWQISGFFLYYFSDYLCLLLCFGELIYVY